MARQWNIATYLNLRKKAGLRGFATVKATSNYNVSIADSGKMLIANNLDKPITFWLPQANIANGAWFTFYNMAANMMYIQVEGTISATTNCITSHRACEDLVLNYASAGNLGSTCQMLCDGVSYYVLGYVGAGNLASHIEG